MKYSIILVKACCILACLLCSFHFSYAQSRDSKGTDFWLTFIPNFHDPKTSAADKLYLFITSDRSVTGTIEYHDEAGRLYTQAFSIVDPTQIYTFSTNYMKNGKYLELRGLNQDITIITDLNNHQCEKKASQSFHITSNAEVTVYAMSRAEKTTDAFLVLPTDALGKEYYVMSYNSDRIVDIWGNDGSSTPSQFAVVATEDATDITIYPAAATWVKKNTIPQKITLNKGETYLVQANISVQNPNLDLTGTRIVAQKPIAVFSGHQRATLPLESGMSRDCLIEQMPSIDTWGKDAFLTPLSQPANITSFGTDLFRVLFAVNKTNLYINDKLIGTFNAGQYYEDSLTFAAHIRADTSILVAEFKKTSGLTSQDNSISDPFMMLIPPSEQFLTSYRWMNAQVGSGTNAVYKDQYVTVVAPASAVPAMTVDGSPVNAASFTSIPNSTYAYATIKLNDGVHSIQADTGIGIYVYGYGVADSYGYIGGINMAKLNIPDTLRAYLSISDAKAHTGETVPVVIHLDSLQRRGNAIQSTNAKKLFCDMRFNATVLTPEDPSIRGTIGNGYQTVHLELPLDSIPADAVLTSLRMTAGLGDAEYSSVELMNPVWLTEENDTIPSYTFLHNGVFSITNVWKDRMGARLINPEEGRLGLRTIAGGTSPQFEVRGDWHTRGGSLKIYNTTAQEVLDLTSKLPESGSGTIPLSSTLPSGTYFCRLCVGTEIVVRPFIIP